MVLTIMFVLIFILAGTIAVVYSAHNRAMIKYEGSQGYYGTRSIIDSYANTLLLDDTTKTTEGYYYLKEDKSTPTNDGTSSNALTQGRALELDLYSVTVNTSGDWYQKKIVNEGKNIDYVNPTFTNDSYIEQYNIATTGDTLTYKLSSGLDSWASGYGRLADPGTDITVEVKVLERVLDLGTGANVTAMFKQGAREKDYFKIQVTSKLTYNGEEYTTVKILETDYTATPPASNAVTSFGVIKPGANLAIYGGASSLTPNAVDWNNNSRVSSNVYFQSDFKISTAKPIFYLGEDGLFFVRGKLEGGAIANQDSQQGNQCPYTKGATFYASSMELNHNSGIPWGTETNKLNFVCKDFYLTDAEMYINANVYCENFYMKSLGNKADDTFNLTVYCNNLYTEYGRYVDSASKYVLDVQSGSADYITQADARHFSTNDGTNKGRFTAGSAIYCTKIVDISTGVSYDASACDRGNAPVIVPKTYSPALSLDFESAPAVSEATFREITLPSGVTLDGRTEDTKLLIDTPKGLYKQYFDDTTWDANGDFNCNFHDESTLNTFIEAHRVIAEMPAYDSSNEGTAISLSNANDGETDTEVITHYNELKTRAATLGISSYSLVKSKAGMTFYKLKNNDFKQIIFDATYGDIYVYLDSNAIWDPTSPYSYALFSGSYATYGDNKVFFVFANNNYKYRLGDASAGGSGGFDVFDMDYGCTAAQISASLPGGILDIDNPPKSPNIYYYIAKDITVPEIQIDNNNKNIGVMQGYFVVPHTNIVLYGEGKGEVKTKDEGKFVHGGNSEGAVKYMGSIVCGNYEGNSAKPGIAFIAPNEDKEDKGNIMLKWQTIYNDDLIS